MIIGSQTVMPGTLRFYMATVVNVGIFTPPLRSWCVWTGLAFLLALRLGLTNANPVSLSVSISALVYET